MGDRVVKINGVDFSNIEHREAVETIRKAGNRIVFTVERKVLASEREGHDDYIRSIPSEATSIASLQTTPSITHSGPSYSTFSKPDIRTEPIDDTEASENRTSVPASSPSPHLVFPCPKPYKGVSNEKGSSTDKEANFDAMIPSEVKNPSAVVTVTIKQPDAVSTKVPELFLPAPTDLGTVTETITKSTLTETVFTRVTHNEAVMTPVLTEVCDHVIVVCIDDFAC
jgi:protein scribble